jgi:hypothetical protein
MRLILTTAIAAIMTLSLPAADIAGTWKGSMDTPMGNVETTITLQAGETLAGTVKVAEYEAKIENAKLEGDKIYFEINIEPGKMTYEGTVAGDEMKLTVTGTTGNKYQLNCKRQK